MQMLKYVLMLLLLILLFGCGHPVKTGILYASNSIAESKEKEVFIAEYIPDKVTLNLNGRDMQILEVWMEKNWSYLNQFGDIEILDGVSGYIKLNINHPDEISNIKFTYSGYSVYGTKHNKFFFQVKPTIDTIRGFFHDDEKEIAVMLIKKN